MRVAAAVLFVTFAAGAPAWAGARDTRLIDAVKAGSVAAVRATLKLGVDVKATMPDGATALHWAAEFDRVDVADVLLTAGAHVNAENDYGVSPIMLAATNGSAPMIERLIAAGASANAALPTGETVLMTAVHTGKVEAVRALMAHGANVNAKENVKGQTALMWAIWQGYNNVARMLVEAGANVTAPSDSGFTPLLFAAREGNMEIARLLLSKGASVNETAKDGNSALHVAVVRGYVEIAKFLLDQGADPSASGPGFTPLHWAAGTWESIHSHDYIFNETAVNTVHEWQVLAGIPSQQAKHDLIRALLAKGANINARITKAPPKYGFSLFKSQLLDGATPFFVAAIVADVPTMKLLLANGADPKLKAAADNTALMAVCGIAHVDAETREAQPRAIEAVQLLLSLGFDINEANVADNAPLHAAAMAGYDAVAAYLVEHGAAVNARNKAGETPLKLATGFIENTQVWKRPNVESLLRKMGGVE